MSYACTVEPLRAANLLSQRRLYDVLHFGEAHQVASSGAAVVDGLCRTGGMPDVDLVLVVAGGDPFAFDDKITLKWLQRLDRAGIRLGGVSGGAVILAKAGLMSGRRFTVHWEHAEQLADHFPDCLVDRKLFVIDRDRVTCGGGAAPLDLMHALIASQHGSEFSRRVSDWFLHTDIRGSSDPQRSTLVARPEAQSQHVSETIDAMECHIADPLSLQQLALITDITPRHLNRLFKGAFGKSAMTYYRDLRLDTARRLVRSTAMSFSRIAMLTGFSHAGHFSNAYVARFDVRPGADRAST